MKKTGCLLLLIAALLLALWVEVYNHDIHLSLPLPHFNLRQVESLASSINPQAHARADASGSAYVVTGSPSITATLINRVLAAYHSPAAGLGQTLSDDGVNYGIDPAYALAFFMHESTFGTQGMARAARSLGNLRCVPAYPCYEGYAAFSSWQAGFAAWYFLIRDLYVGQWHLTTVAQIVPTYAPTRDHNNVPGYIAAIEHAVDTWRAGKVVVS